MLAYYFTLLLVSTGNVYSSLHDLCLVALAPYPDSAASPNFRPGWDGGPAVISAARLAAEAINNRTEILEGYRLRLLEGDSGCNVESKAVVSLAGNAFHRDCPAVGIVGPACSGAAAIIGGVLAREGSNLLQISPSATSPLLADSSAYPNTYRVLSSSLEYVGLYSELIHHNTWNSVATLYDANRIIFLSTFHQFRNRINISYSSPVSTSNIPLNDIHTNYKVIFVFAGEELSRRILCLAYHFQPSLTYPVYQWIFQDKREYQFWQNVTFSFMDTTYTCSRQQMMKATEGIILNIYRLKRDDVLSQTDVGFTLKTFYELYQPLLTQHLREINLTRSDYALMAEEWAPVYYDAVWAMAMALHRAQSDLMHFENLSLSSYKYGNPRATTLIKEQLELLDFEGLSGRIMFRNDTHDTATIINVYQIKYNASTESSSSILVGYCNDSRLEITESAEFVPSSFGMVQESVHPVFTVIFTVLILLCTGCVATLHFLVVKYSDSAPVRAASPRLSQLIFSGCYLILFLAFSLVLITSRWFISTIQPLSHEHFIVYGVFCNVAAWNVSAGYTLILSCLLVQLWRIYNIFNSFRKKQCFLSDESLVCIVAVLLAVNCVIHLAWVLTDPFLATFTTLEMIESYEEHPVILLRFKCVSDSVNIFDGITIGFNCFISMCLVVLSILNRHIKKKNFKNTSGVNVFVYVFVVMTLFASYLALAIGNTLLFVFLLWELCFLISVFIVSTLLFLPRVLSALKLAHTNSA